MSNVPLADAPFQPAAEFAGAHAGYFFGMGGQSCIKSACRRLWSADTKCQRLGEWSTRSHRKHIVLRIVLSLPSTDKGLGYYQDTPLAERMAEAEAEARHAAQAESAASAAAAQAAAQASAAAEVEHQKVCSGLVLGCSQETYITQTNRMYQLLPHERT